MKRSQTTALVIVLLIVVGVVAAKVATRKGGDATPPEDMVASAVPSQPAENAPEAAVLSPDAPVDTAAQQPDADSESPLPKLLELGSVGCKPCEHMAPIIDALEQELQGKVFVKFYDVAKTPAMAKKYEIITIPTQVFLDADGTELFRHIGTFEKDEILGKLRELGMLKE